MKRAAETIAVAALACCLAPSASAQEKPAGGETVVLDTSGFWRLYLTLRTPLVRDGALRQAQGAVSLPNGETLKEIGAACNTLPPAKDWTGAEFDDSAWVRLAGAPFASWSHWDPGAQANVGFVYCHGSSLATAQICLRGKFHVDDPARARGMKLSVVYRGGAAVYLNGKELARSHLPREGALAPETPAEMYPREAYCLEDGDLMQGYGRKGSKSERLQLRLRTLEATVPPEALRKGTNVLALSLHRAPLPRDVYEKLKGMRENLLFCLWDACGLYSVRLTAPATAAVRANATRPAGVQLWNSSVLASDTDLDWGDPYEPLKPIEIVGARNGNFSGKVVLGSDRALRNLKASISDLTQTGGAVIPASAVALRFAIPDLPRKPSNANRFDSLLEAPPAEVTVRQKQPQPNWVRTLPGQPAPVYGAVAPIWVTVRVPADAKPGDYAGTLTASANDRDFAVPVKLRVSGFRLPDPKDYQTFVELVESPDTLAVEYGVSLWSDAHWKLIDKSLALIGQVGAKTCYVPLICETNLGNEQTMVRWVKQGKNQYRHDFSILDKYLDLVAKHQGPSTRVCFYVWDNFLEGGRFGGDLKYESKETQGDRLAYKGKGPGVTVCSAAFRPYSGRPDAGIRAEARTTNDVAKVMLPQYSDPAAKPLWEGLAKELLERMRKRGMEKGMMLGLLTDTLPTAAVVGFWGELLPGVPWASHAHPYRDKVHGVPVAYTSAVWHPRFISYDGTSRQGWRNPRLMMQFARDVSDLNPLTTFGLIGEMNVGGDQRGFTRFGADFWPVKVSHLHFAHGRYVPNEDVTPGEWTGRVYERYPKASWRNLNIKVGLLGPGPQGPVATARFEVLREGIEACEARVSIERALEGGKLAPELAEKCRELIAERNRAIAMGLSPHKMEGFLDAAAYARTHDWHCDAGSVGYTWYLTSGWQERSEKLYRVAAEVAAKPGAE